jgi:hypothetical protein
MPVTYVDYNIIVIAARLPVNTRAEEARAQFVVLMNAGHRFALSAWHAFELAKSDRQDHIDACCQFVEALGPLWLSNSRYVKREELHRFLYGAPDGRPVSVFNDCVWQMWATYDEGGAILIGDSFNNTVRQLRQTPGAVAQVQAEAAQTPGATRIARAARDLGVNVEKQLVDSEYFAMYLDPVDRLLGAPQRLVKIKPEVMRKCPAVAVDERVNVVRVSETYDPLPSDAADLQHATVALAYCDHFVTDEKRLSRHCVATVRRCGLRCTVHRALSELLPPEPVPEARPGTI